MANITTSISLKGSGGAGSFVGPVSSSLIGQANSLHVGIIEDYKQKIQTKKSSNQPRKLSDFDDSKDFDMKPPWETPGEKRKRERRESDEKMENRKRYLENHPDEAERLKRKWPKPIYPTWLPEEIWDAKEEYREWRRDRQRNPEQE